MPPDPELIIPIIAIMMPVFIIGIIVTYKAFIFRMKQQSEGTSAESRQQFEELFRRLGRIEQRLANLETIVLEAEKQKNFDRSL